MIKKILLVLLAIIVIFAIVAAMQPDDFRVERTATMSAPPAAVFAQVNDLHAWEAWSPWAKLDPNAKTTFEGPSAGVGAIMRWEGNHEVGKGSMAITESKPDELVHYKLEFLEPFAATNDAEFTLKPEGNQTVVTWSMYGKNNFMGKAMGLIMNCDQMVGDQFDQGLANLKSIVEGK